MSENRHFDDSPFSMASVAPMHPDSDVIFSKRLAFNQHSFCPRLGDVNTACTQIALGVAYMLLTSDDNLIVDDKARLVNIDALFEAFKRGYVWWSMLAVDRFMSPTAVIAADRNQPFEVSEHFGVIGARQVSPTRRLSIASETDTAATSLYRAILGLWNRSARGTSRCATFTYGGGTICLYMPHCVHAGNARGWLVDSHPRDGAEVLCFDSAESMSRFILRTQCGLDDDAIAREMGAPLTPRMRSNSLDSSAAHAACVDTNAIYHNEGERANIPARQYDLVELTLRVIKANSS